MLARRQPTEGSTTHCHRSHNPDKAIPAPAEILAQLAETPNSCTAMTANRMMSSDAVSGPPKRFNSETEVELPGGSPILFFVCFFVIAILVTSLDQYARHQCSFSACAQNAFFRHASSKAVLDQRAALEMAGL
jgi:hypothetical protein